MMSAENKVSFAKATETVRSTFIPVYTQLVLGLVNIDQDPTLQNTGSDPLEIPGPYPNLN